MADSFWETIELNGNELLKKMQELIAEGNVRHVRIRQGERTLVEFPVTVGVVGVVLAPVLAAVGALAALLAECSIDVERVMQPAAKANDDTSPPTAGS